MLGRPDLLGVGSHGVRLRGGERCQREEVPCPGAERDVEPVAEVVAASLVALAGGRVVEPASRGRGGRPSPARRGRTPAASPRLTTTRRREAPRQPQATSARHVSLPSQPPERARLPFAVAEDRIGERSEQPLVEGPELGIGRLVGPAGEEDRHVNRPPVELAFVDDARAGLGQRRDRCSARLAPREGRRRPRLVVVLDEADEPLDWYARVRDQMATNPVGVAVREAVVEALVVAVVEALLLECPLEIPVGLGDEDEVRMVAPHRANHGGPVVGVRLRACARPTCARSVAHHQHGHVAANAVALRGDRLQGLDRGRPLIRREGIQLHDVRPGREERVAAPGQDRLPGPHVRGGIAREVVLAPAHEVLGVRLDPRVVGRNVVGHEVEDQRHPALCERGSCSREAGGAAQVRVDRVAPDAVRRADDVIRAEVGQRAPERRGQAVVLERDGDSRRASLPDAHQPNRVEAELPDRVPFLRGHACQIEGPFRCDGSARRARPRC